MVGFLRVHAEEEVNPCLRPQAVGRRESSIGEEYLQ